jgi:hypothetical protein
VPFFLGDACVRVVDGLGSSATRRRGAEGALAGPRGSLASAPPVQSLPGFLFIQREEALQCRREAAATDDGGNDIVIFVLFVILPSRFVRWSSFSPSPRSPS